MTKGFWIVLAGAGGELDRRFAKTEDDIKQKLLELVSDCVFSDGDKITIEAGESEDA
jgi:hypothetical protein